jgi:YHS domain-containing protein
MLFGLGLTGVMGIAPEVLFGEDRPAIMTMDMTNGAKPINPVGRVFLPLTSRVIHTPPSSQPMIMPIGAAHDNRPRGSTTRSTQNFVPPDNTMLAGQKPNTNSEPKTFPTEEKSVSPLTGISKWVKHRIPGGSDDDKDTAKNEKGSAPRNHKITEAPASNAVMTQSTQNGQYAAPAPTGKALPNSSNSEVMRELEKLYEQNGVPAPEFHPMLEAKAVPPVVSEKNGRFSRRDSKVLNKFGINQGSLVDGPGTHSGNVTSAPNVSSPQQVVAPASPITVQINLTPTPVTGMPGVVQYQVQPGQTVANQAPAPVEEAAPLQAKVRSKSTLPESEYFPEDRHEVHNSEDGEFFINDRDVDEDEEMEAPMPAPKAKKVPQESIATNETQSSDAPAAMGMFPAAEGEDEPDNSVFQTPKSMVSAKEPKRLEPQDNPFTFSTAGIDEADGRVTKTEPAKQDTWVKEMNKAPNKGVEANTVSISRELAPKISQDFDKVRNESTADRRQRLIKERSGQSGLKGFCPVVLRDQRELIDGKITYRVEHEGKTYLVSSTEAQAKFAADPDKYAPANQGNDIVQQQKSGTRVEGNLDYALWFRGRLYLFNSQENQNEFAQNPKAYIK